MDGLKFEVTAVNVQENETQVVFYGVGAAKDEVCQFANIARNSIISLWLKSEPAKKFIVGQAYTLSELAKES